MTTPLAEMMARVICEHVSPCRSCEPHCEASTAFLRAEGMLAAAEALEAGIVGEMVESFRWAMKHAESLFVLTPYTDREWKNMAQARAVLAKLSPPAEGGEG